jgi:hypothetical protein
MERETRSVRRKGVTHNIIVVIQDNPIVKELVSRRRLNGRILGPLLRLSFVYKRFRPYDRITKVILKVDLTKLIFTLYRIGA